MILVIIEDLLNLIFNFNILSRLVGSKKIPVRMSVIVVLLSIILIPQWYPKSFEFYIELITTVIGIIVPALWLNYYTRSTIDSIIITLLGQIFKVVLLFPFLIILLLLSMIDPNILNSDAYSPLNIFFTFLLFLAIYLIDRKMPLKKISLIFIKLNSRSRLYIASAHVISYTFIILLVVFQTYFFGDSMLTYFYLVLIYALFGLFLFYAVKQNKATQSKTVFFNSYVNSLFNVLYEYKSMYLERQNQIEHNDFHTSTIPEPSIHYDYFSNLNLLQNKVLSAFLYSQYIEAKKMGVQLSCSIESNLVSCGLTNFQLIDIFSIVTNNAIEAAKLTRPSYVDLIITEKIDPTTKKPLYLLLVNNTTTPLSPYQIQKMFDKGISSKNENPLSSRGLGLYKLKHILKHNNGQIDVSYNEYTSCLEMKIAFC